MDIKALIPGAERVIEMLGCWPSFHGAEVVSFSVSRALPGQAPSTTANLFVHARADHGEEIAAAAGQSSHSALIELVMRDIEHLALYDFNEQNVLDLIDFSQSGGTLIAVEIVSDWGVGGAVRCAHVEVGQILSLA
ncbi:Uncharacterised protein [Bordetella ansorpii]|uniref:Uncharacterized protein n=1 Tax=Bordetella ansorpii TaxID=288768 RepID=A0A157SUM7_9BORD|nr:Imm50 family immunity protein [Bordetella ansorpii]SAI74147.1 Uncharacterised protein [Bordetella ansorpii]